MPLEVGLELQSDYIYSKRQRPFVLKKTAEVEYHIIKLISHRAYDPTRQVVFATWFHSNRKTWIFRLILLPETQVILGIDVPML